MVCCESCVKKEEKSVEEHARAASSLSDVDDRPRMASLTMSSLSDGQNSGEFEEETLGSRQLIYLGRFVIVLIIPVVTVCLTVGIVLAGDSMALTNAYNALDTLANHGRINSLCWCLQRERSAVLAFRSVTGLVHQTATSHADEQQEMLHTAALALIRLNSFYGDTDMALDQWDLGIEQMEDGMVRGGKGTTREAKAVHCARPGRQAIDCVVNGTSNSGSDSSGSSTTGSSITSFRLTLRQLRQTVKGNYSGTNVSETIFSDYSTIVSHLLKLSSETLVLPEMVRPWRLLTASSALLGAANFMASYQALGSIFWSHCNLFNIDLMSGAQIDADVALKIAIRLLSEGPWLGDMATLPDYHLAHDCALADSSINTANNSSCKNLTSTERLVTSETWTTEAEDCVARAYSLHLSVSHRLKVIVDEFVWDVQRRIALYACFVGVALMGGVGLCFWYGLSTWRLLARIVLFAKILKTKTEQLRCERHRSDVLFIQILPRPVALALKLHHEVLPKYFDEATIFFCDVVDFESICNNVTPHQVVSLLNTLYNVIDGCLAHYDVYKVETIRDTYMVSSGVPQTGNERHAEDIAHMAMLILVTMAKPTLPLLLLHRLQLRIGIHTGPVIAGVIGTKMPRYCLFGDTVNLASRLKTTGEGNKIQLSEYTNFILKSFGFTTTPRGLVQVKGKGLLQTHWLVGCSHVQLSDDMDADTFISVHDVKLPIGPDGEGDGKLLMK